jgi:asparagine synthase (glutamine-hydrolysing)
MCGILLVKSLDSIPLQKHLSAFALLNSRGPDFSRYRYNNNIFIGQTVLHITGSVDYYHHEHTNFLAYNGEIYNYRELGNYGNDVEFVHDCVENCIDRINSGWGPWAWAWTDGVNAIYATDPQGERCLFQYQDDQILIVCSEIAPILEYIGSHKIDLPYVNKLWNIIDATPYTGIVRIAPGQLYQDGRCIRNIDNIWSWIKPTRIKTFDEAYEDFKHTWNTVTGLMTPDCTVALSYSGGLDSSVILSHIDNLELYAVNNIGKDPIVDCIREFLTETEQTQLHELTLDPKKWAQEFVELVKRVHLPAQSWSHIGQWLVVKHCDQRVLFTGAGADELFGGYDIYQQLTYTTDRSASPYSKYGNSKLWKQCLDAYEHDPKQATLLMDYLYQVSGCDVRGIDVITGAWGIEPRNPFLARPVMQLALNLPIEFKLGTVSKPLIRRLFQERWPESMILPKKGFTGHANDSLPYLPISIEPTGDRLTDWKQISRKMFYDCGN